MRTSALWRWSPWKVQKRLRQMSQTKCGVDCLKTSLLISTLCAQKKVDMQGVSVLYETPADLTDLKLLRSPSAHSTPRRRQLLLPALSRLFPPPHYGARPPAHSLGRSPARCLGVWAAGCSGGAACRILELRLLLDGLQHELTAGLHDLVELGTYSVVRGFDGAGQDLVLAWCREGTWGSCRPGSVHSAGWTTRLTLSRRPASARSAPPAARWPAPPVG